MAKKLKVALTFDDGPHISPWSACTTRPITGTTECDRTLGVIQTLNSHNIDATFFVEMQRAKTSAGATALTAMKNGGHEIGLHGVNPNVHHQLHQDAPSQAQLETWLTDLKDRINDVTELTPTWVRPPGGVIGADDSTLDVDDLDNYYSNVGLSRYTGDGASNSSGGRINSWWAEIWNTLPPENPGARSQEDFEDAVCAKVDAAYEQDNTQRMIVLGHDLRVLDYNELPNIINYIADYASQEGVTLQFVKLSNLAGP